MEKKYLSTSHLCVATTFMAWIIFHMCFLLNFRESTTEGQQEEESEASLLEGGAGDEDDDDDSRKSGYFIGLLHTT